MIHASAWNPRRCSVWLSVFIVLTCALWATTSEARIPQPVAFDVTLLRSDCVLFATIADLRPVQGHDDLIEIVLERPNVVTSRWADPPRWFRVRGTRFTAGGVDRVQSPASDFGLAVGERHLFFLRGGEWTDAPFAPAAYGHYPLDADGRIRCDAQGLVYELGADGVLCSTPAQQAGPPMTEAALSTRLRRSLANARERRPEDAAALDASVQPLRQLPRGW